MAIANITKPEKCALPGFYAA